MTNDKRIEKFRATLDELNGSWEKSLPERKQIQAEFDVVIQAEWKKLFGRKKYSHVEAMKDIPNYEEIRKPFQDRSNKMLAEISTARATLKNALEDMAANIVIEKKDLLKEEWARYGEFSTSDYSSQGFGAAKYARASAEGLLEHVRQYADAEIRQVNREPVQSCGYTMEMITYHIFVAGDETDCEIIRRKPGVLLRTTVKRLLKSCVNPRVLFPFLGTGYEASVGLDYFGNNIKK